MRIQHEVQRTLRRLTTLGYAMEQRTWFFDKTSPSDKYYPGNAYKLSPEFATDPKLEDEVMQRTKPELNTVKFTEPTRIAIEYPLTVNEIQVVRFLYHESDSITISDLSDIFDLHESVVNRLVKRLSDPVTLVDRMKSSVPELLVLNEGWTLSNKRKISKLAKSPLISLNPHYRTNEDFKEFIEIVEVDSKIDYQDTFRKLIPVDYPISMNEIYVLKYLFDKNVISQKNALRSVDIYKNLILKPDPKINKSLVLNNLKRLIDPSFISKRMGSDSPAILEKTLDKKYFIAQKYVKDQDFKNFLSDIIEKLDNTK